MMRAICSTGGSASFSPFIEPSGTLAKPPSTALWPVGNEDLPCTEAMSFGVVIRIALVVGWLALISVHLVRHALPGLGVTERRDFAATLAQQIDRTLTYTVRANDRDLGRCVLSFEREDAGYTLTTLLDLSGLPGMTGLPGMLGNPGAGLGSRLRATAEQRYDDRLRLVGLRGHGDVYGLPLTLDATVDHRGLLGTVNIGGVSRPIAVPELGDSADQGFAFALSLPPGLVVGERFRTTMTDIDWTLVPRRVIAVFSVEARDDVETVAGLHSLLRVSMVHDGTPSGMLWCDDDGTVYRMAMERAAVTMELQSITHASDGRIWPALSVQP